MEDVIVGLLFLYFFVIRPIVKQARAAAGKKKEGRPAAARSRTPLLMLLEKIKEKLKEAAEHAEAGKRGGAGDSTTKDWKGLFAEAAERRRTEPSEEVPGHDLDAAVWRVEESWRPGEPDPSPRRWEAEPPGEPEPAPEASEPDVDPEGKPAPGLRPPRIRRPAQRGINLRQAVVWSEILGPPVSLREGE